MEEFMSLNSGEHVNAADPAGCLLADEYLWQNYRLRRNVLSGKVEYRSINEDDARFRPLTSQAINSIILKSRRDGYADKEDIAADLKLLFDSDDIPEFDPAKEWLESLHWDGNERLVDFWKRIPGISAEHIFYLIIWQRSMVAQWLGMNKEHGNECVPTLVGSQGIGKSTFFIRMLPEELRQYYLDNFRLANNFDKDMALTNNLLVNLDEFDMYTNSQQAQVKQSLSRVRVNGRKIYGRTQEDRRRYASFVATTNNLQPLGDPTGSRRYICLAVPQGQYIDNDTELDIAQIYAQLVHEVVEKKERYWFTNDETIRIMQLNSPFQQVKGIEQMVASCVAHIGEGSAEEYISTADIINKVKAVYPYADHSKLSSVRVGRIMKELGFTRKHFSNCEKYVARLTVVA